MKSAMRAVIIPAFMFIVIAVPSLLIAQKPGPASCYSSLLTGPPPTLSASVQSIDSNGTVVVNGGDTAQPSTPFKWAWGDGSSTSGFFPQQHVYADTSQNYDVTITATENNGTTQQVSFPVFFTAPTITPQTFSEVSFQIPSQSVTLQAHWPYPPPTDVEPFPDSSFPEYSRSDMEYVLAAVSSIDYTFANENSFLLNGQFTMDMLEGTDFGGGSSFWYTTPMSVGYGPTVVGPSPQWYILFNEIGKDATLNSPQSLTFGGNTDGDASEIYSETMGDIFSYASGCQLISNATAYGLGPDVELDIQNSMLSGAAGLQGAFNAYVAAGAPFTTWNPNNGSPDPTIPTISTLAWKFIEHAELQGQGYEIPTTRLMKFLQMFDSSMLASYAPQDNTQTAATFRSTLMVAGLSYAFSEDLRSEFEALNFPIDDSIFEQLYQMATGGEMLPTVTLTPTPTSVTTAQQLSVKVTVSGPSGSATPTGSVTLSGGGYTAQAQTLSSGVTTFTIPAGDLAVGADTLTANYTPDSNSSSTYTSGAQITTVTVTVAPSFALSNGGPVTVSVGSGGTTSLTVTPSGSFTGQVDFACAVSGSPTGLTCSASSANVVGPSAVTSTLTVATTAETPAGIYTATVTATDVATGKLTATTSVTITVNAVPSFSLASSGSITVTAGNSGTSTLTVTPSGGFTGAVNFSCSVAGSPAGLTCSAPNANVTGSSAVSSTLTVATTSATPAATYIATITATSANNLTGVTTVLVTVTAPQGFTLSASPTIVSVAQGNSGTATITVTDVGSFSGTVTLSTSVLPSGVTASFAAGSAAGTQVLTLAANSSAAVTSTPVTVTITGTSGTLTATTSVALSITAQPSFTAGSGGTTSITVTPGSTTGNTGTVSVVGTNGFAGTVTLTCTVATVMTNVNDMPTCSLNPMSVAISGTASQTSTLTVTTTAASSAENQMKKLFWPPAGGTALAFVVFFMVPKRRRTRLVMMGLLLIFVSINAMGCGGGGSGGSRGGGGNTGTTPGTYTVTVAGTSGMTNVTIGVVTLTVQ